MGAAKPVLGTEHVTGGLPPIDLGRFGQRSLLADPGSLALANGCPLPLLRSGLQQLRPTSRRSKFGPHFRQPAISGCLRGYAALAEKKLCCHAPHWSDSPSQSGTAASRIHADCGNAQRQQLLETLQKLLAQSNP